MGKKYGKRSTCAFARKQIEYDIKHGVSRRDPLRLSGNTKQVRICNLRKFPNWIERLAALEGQFDKPGMSTMGSYAGGLKARGY
jgi:hypothetical protein